MAYWFHGSSKLQSPNRCTGQQWCEIEISIGRNDNNIWSKDSWGHCRSLESQKTCTCTHHIALCQSPEVTHNRPIQNQVSLYAVFGWRPLSSSCVQHHARCLKFVRTGYSDLSSFVWGSSISTSTWWGTFPNARLISERLTASLFMYSIWCHRTSIRRLEFIRCENIARVVSLYLDSSRPSLSLVNCLEVDNQYWISTRSDCILSQWNQILHELCEKYM